jgi:hypothetical protein
MRFLSRFTNTDSQIRMGQRECTTLGKRAGLVPEIAPVTLFAVEAKPELSTVTDAQ